MMSDKLKKAAREYFQKTLAVAERDRQGVRLMGSQLEIRLRSLAEATQYAEDSIRCFKQDNQLPRGFDKVAEDEGTKIEITAEETPLFCEYLLCADHEKWLIMHDRYAGRDAQGAHYDFLYDGTSDSSTSSSISNPETPSVSNLSEQSVPSTATIARFADQFSPPLEWRELTITFKTNEMVDLYGREKKAKYGFAELGFKDGRKGDEPNSLWRLLRDGFGQNKGQISWTDLGTTDKTQQDQMSKMVSRMRLALRNGIGISDDPFLAYGKARGYELKFNLFDHRHSPAKNSDFAASDTSFEEEDIYDIADLIREETEKI